MCGRFLLSIIPAEFAGLLRIDHIPNLGPDLYTPRFNIAPTQQIIIARNSDTGKGSRELASARWGLIPHWAPAQDAFKRPIFNARSETAWKKPMFRDAVRTRRCVIPADGFYEWQKPATRSGHKQPYLIQRSDRSPMFFAGIWSSWCQPESPGASSIESCAILTTTPNDVMALIHDRMPVILCDNASIDHWLTPDQVPRPEVENLLRPCPASVLFATPIDEAGEYRRTKKRPDNDLPRSLFE